MMLDHTQPDCQASAGHEAADPVVMCPVVNAETAATMLDCKSCWFCALPVSATLVTLRRCSSAGRRLLHSHSARCQPWSPPPAGPAS